MKKIIYFFPLLLIFGLVGCRNNSSDEELLSAKIQDIIICNGKELNSPFADGVGTVDEPYIICSSTQFNQIGSDLNYLDKNFSLKKDISLSDLTVNLIGSTTNPFIGSFDGGNYRISDFNYSAATTDFVGLFSKIGTNGVVKNLGLINSTVVGQNDVGILVGENSGLVENCYTKGSVSGQTRVGGLAGRFWESASGVSTIRNSYSEATVNGTGFVGGLVGWVRGKIKDSYAKGVVTSAGDRIGGLVGTVDQGQIEGCYATGAVTGRDLTGGLIGIIGGYILDSHSTGNVNGRNYVGGISGSIGQGSGSGYIDHSYSSSQVTAQNYIGGISGWVYLNYGIKNSYFNGSISGGTYIGALGGVNYAQTLNSYSSSASLTGTSAVGGLHGYSGVENIGCFWDAEISSIGTSSNGAGLDTAGALTTAEMKTASTYSDASWSTSLWKIVGGQYPTH